MTLHIYSIYSLQFIALYVFMKHSFLAFSNRWNETTRFKKEKIYIDVTGCSVGHLKSETLVKQQQQKSIHKAKCRLWDKADIHNSDT